MYVRERLRLNSFSPIPFVARAQLLLQVKHLLIAVLGGCLIYEIVLDIFFRFLGLVFFISSIYIVGCRGNCSLFFGLKVQELGFGIRGRDGGQCNPRKCFAAFVEHAQLEDAPLWIRFVPSSQSLPAFFFVFSLFFVGCIFSFLVFQLKFN